MYTLIIGFDAFDPTIFEKLMEQGRLPNLEKLAAAGGYSPFAVANPAQSEVSWTSIATGANPGEHGLFDFVHRDPASYSPFVSLLPTKSDLLGTRFTPPVQARTIFDQAAQDGYPATALYWPAAFPARLDSPVRVIPGLGTPDVQGKLGIGCGFIPGAEGERTPDSTSKTPVEPLQRVGPGRYRGAIKGPEQMKNGRSQARRIEFQLEASGEDSAALRWDKQTVNLKEGEWSPIIELTFKAGWFVNIRAITRALLTRVEPEPRLYFLPLQLHPLHSAWPYASPAGFMRETWNQAGPYLTLGWPQDTTGLEDGWMNDDQFLELCRLVDAERERVFFHHLGQFREGVLAVVFDTLDRIQHMFWRDRPDIVEDWYCRLDAFISRVNERLGNEQARGMRLLVVSDHGFSRFDHKVHLNRWLEERGYLRPANPGAERDLRNVDWSATRAYAIGLNSLYLNLEGREGQGSVSPAERDSLLHKLREELAAWQGPDGGAVMQRVYLQEEAFAGRLSAYSPDLVLGYRPGYRASAQTGLGEWAGEAIEPNRDHWGADHCIDPQAVPGVLFANQDLSNFPHPSYRDIPALALGKHIDPGRLSPPPSTSIRPEDQEAVEERLKSLGYL